jgi:hypothetical protein
LGRHIGVSLKLMEVPMGWFDPVGWAKAGVNFVEDKASDAWDDAKDVASSAADTASNAASDAWDGLAGAAKTVEQAPAALIHLGSDAIDAISHPMATAQAMIGGISRGANAVSHFVGDHGSEILTGLEIGGNVALTASGLGPIAGGLIAAGFAAADGIAHGKSADDVIVNSLVAGADKVLPGSGHATEAVVKGIEHGESAQQIVHEAGLDGVGAIAGPALDSAARFVDDLAHGRSPGRVFLDGLDAANEIAKSAGHTGLDTAGANTDQFFPGSGDNAGLTLGLATTFAEDLAHDRSPGRIFLDGVTQYVNEASGVGTGHANLLGEAGIIALNDVVDGKSAGDIGLDIAKAYVHEAAGGDASPAAQFTDTFFNDLEQGKSPRVAMDMVHKAEGMIERIEPDLPVVIHQVLGTSDVPGSKYAATFVDDLLHGKSFEQAAEHTGRQAAGDAVDQSGLGDAFKDTGLDRLAPYAETAADDFLHGKSFEQIAEHVGRQVLGDAFDQSGVTHAVNQVGSVAQNALGDLPDGGIANQIFGDIGQQVSHGGIHPDWVELNPQPLPPMPDPDGGDSSPWSKAISWAELNPQPLPPGPDPEAGTHLSDPITAVGLNPQPLPPGPDPQGGIHLSDAVLTAGPDPAAHAMLAELNPQPLPPAPVEFQDYGMLSIPALPFEPALH